jgi:uncharacterized membrane protein
MINDVFSSTAFNIATGIGLLLGVVTTIFWMIVGWRAMRAHERIAEILEVLWADAADERLARVQSQNPPPPK